MKNSFLLLSLFIFCFGCATPYQPLGFKGGYSDLQLGNDTVRVSFKGNGYTSSDTVEAYLLYRCAELTAQRGFDYFVMINDTGQTIPYVYGDANGVSTVAKHSATAIIKLYKGAIPSTPGAFGAKDLMKNIRSQVMDLQEEAVPTPGIETERLETDNRVH